MANPTPMKTIAFVAAFILGASAQSLQDTLENAILPVLLQGNVPSLAAALSNNTSLSVNMTEPVPAPAPAPSDISISITLPPVMVPSIAPAAGSRLMTPSIAPAADAFTGPPATGAPLSVSAELAPGTVAVITPPAYGNASLPGELPMPQLLASFVAPYLARLPGNTLHLLGSSGFLPHLPAPLRYSNVQGGIVVVLSGNGSMGAASFVPFQATVLGISPSYTALATSPALSPAPANFTPPVLPGLNITYYALAPGTALPAVPSNYGYAQLAPGVLAIVSQIDQQYLVTPPVVEASPATPQGSASTAQSLVSSLTPAEVAALPSVPEGLQIILLPANLSLEGLPASMAIPASFTIPQQLQSYSYILTAASDPLPTLPAGFNASSPSSGITIVYAEQAAPPPAAAPAGPAAASVLALPLSAVMEGPFVLSAAAPLASGFDAPPYLQDFRLSELPAGSLLPIVPTGFTVLPIYPGLTVIVQANSSLLPSSTAAPAPVSSAVLDSPLPAALLNNMPAFSTPAGSLITGVPVTANATQILASSNSTLYTGPTETLPPDETYLVQPVQPMIASLFPGFGIGGVFGSILGVAA